MKVEYKPIEGFDNYYVCNSGVNEQTVLSTKGTMKWLSPYTDKGGYKQVGLCKDGKRHHKSVHRLVAEAFIPNPEGKPCIDHINGDKTDNRVENLRWCTQEENCSFPLARKRKSEVLKGRTKPEGTGTPPKSVEQWSKDGIVLIARYASTMEAERETGCHHSNISNCCNGRCKTVGGYIWRYTCI